MVELAVLADEREVVELRATFFSVGCVVLVSDPL